MAKKAVSKSTEKKIFVLDTSVIIYDHTAIKNFQEHVIFKIKTVGSIIIFTNWQSKIYGIATWI